MTFSRGKGWMALKTALETVREASDAFPPLKTAMGGLVAVMNLVDVSTLH